MSLILSIGLWAFTTRRSHAAGAYKRSPNNHSVIAAAAELPSAGTITAGELTISDQGTKEVNGQAVCQKTVQIPWDSGLLAQ